MQKKTGEKFVDISATCRPSRFLTVILTVSSEALYKLSLLGPGPVYFRYTGDVWHALAEYKDKQ